MEKKNCTKQMEWKSVHSLFIGASLGAFLGLVAYVRDWL
jgi:hypothetical protein